MKKFLFLTCCCFSGAVMAQTLFPELAALEKSAPTKEVVRPAPETNVIQEKVEVLAEEDTLPNIGDAKESEAFIDFEGTSPQNKENTLKNVDEPDTFFAPTNQEDVSDADESPTNEDDEEEDEDSENQYITIYSDNVKATITPNRNFSYCFGEIRFENTLKKPVTEISVDLDYSGIVSSFTVRNLQPKTEKTESLTLVGEACENIMGTPGITIKRCAVPEMAESTCKKKVVFMPLR